VPVKHTFSSAKSDGGDATLVRPTDWNADHGGIWTRRLTTGNQQSTVTTMADVSATDLTVTIAAATSYHWRFSGTYISSVATCGLKLSINGPTSPTFLAMWVNQGTLGHVTTPTYAAFGLTGTSYDTVAVAATAGPAAVVTPFFFEGLIENGANAGTLRPRFASEVAAGASVTIHRGAVFQVFQVDN
jgi:hypothetical protein